MKRKVLATIRKFSKWQWLLLAAFLLVFGITGLHAVRTARDAGRWRHQQQKQQIRGWMTVEYVAYLYHVPAPALYNALDLPNKPSDKRPLRRIAKAQGRTMDEIRTILQDAILRARPSATPLPVSPSPDQAPDKVPDKGGKP